MVGSLIGTIGTAKGITWRLYWPVQNLTGLKGGLKPLAIGQCKYTETNGQQRFMQMASA